MRETRLIMGMPVEIDIVGSDVQVARDAAFDYLNRVDERFSLYKRGSEISRINCGELTLEAASPAMHEVFALAEKTEKETNGYFNIRRPDGLLDPSGIVKGWAIREAATLIRDAGHKHFFVNAGGDIATSGENAAGAPWAVGIRNPFVRNEVVKIIYPRGKGVATSGSYIRGSHIYNPHAPEDDLCDIVSITIVAPDVLEADRYATAAFAMGRDGIAFIEEQPGLEGYAIDINGTAILSSGFAAFTTL